MCCVVGKIGKTINIEEDTLLEKMENPKHIKKKVIREIEEGIHLRKMIKSCEWKWNLLCEIPVKNIMKNQRMLCRGAQTRLLCT